MPGRRHRTVHIPFPNPYVIESGPPPKPPVAMSLVREYVRRERRMSYSAQSSDLFIALIGFTLGNNWILAIAALRFSVDLFLRPSLARATLALDGGVPPDRVVRARVPLYVAVGFTWALVLWPAFIGDPSGARGTVLACSSLVAIVTLVTTVCYTPALFTASCAGFSAGALPMAFFVGGWTSVVTVLCIPILQGLLWNMGQGNRQQYVQALEMQFENDRLLAEQERTIHQLHLSRRHAHELAATDSVTGLPNRQAVLDRIDRLAERADGEFALVLLDLDHFKTINDTMGHSTGDAVLVGMARMLTHHERPGGGDDSVMVARLGGDELAIVIPGTHDPGEIAARFHQWSRCFSQLPVAGAGTLTVSATAGCATFPRDGADQRTLLNAADMALRQAKAVNRGSFQQYRPAMIDVFRRETDIANALSRSIDDRAFAVFLQPQVTIEDGGVVGAEVLTRFTDDELSRYRCRRSSTSPRSAASAAGCRRCCWSSPPTPPSSCTSTLRRRCPWPSTCHRPR